MIKKLLLFTFICTVTQAMENTIDLESDQIIKLVGHAEKLVNGFEIAQNADEEFLMGIEREIDFYVNNLDDEFKKNVRDWNERFSKFKIKLDALKNFIQGEFATNQENMNTDETDFLYLLFGLKPVWIFKKYTEEDYVESFSDLLEKSKRVFPTEISIKSFIKGNEQFHYGISHESLFPFGFISDCYSEQKIRISSWFKENMFDLRKADDSESFTKIIQEITLEKDKLTEDELALLQGYQPIYSTLYTHARYSEMNTYPSHFRHLSFLSSVSCKDNSPYAHLYGKVAQYLWIKLFGIKSYLIRLGHAIGSLTFLFKISEFKPGRSFHALDDAKVAGDISDSNFRLKLAYELIQKAHR